MTAQPQAQAPSRFSLRVPPTWVQFDIQRATRTGELTRIVDEHLAKLPNLRPHRRDILKALRRLAEEAESAGAVLCAAAADEYGEDGRLLATLAAFITEGMPEPALNTVPAIAAQIPATPRPEPDSEGAADADWREVRIVEMDAGHAVRVRSLSTLTAAASGIMPVPSSASDPSTAESQSATPAAATAPSVSAPAQGGDTATTDAATVRLVSMETLIPLPGRERVLNVVLTSPHTNLVDELLELFELISDTLAWEETPGIP